jgi:uncharacterized repeat protein (TIGR02543 family)
VTKGLLKNKRSGLVRGLHISILIALISPVFTVVTAPARAVSPLPICSPEISTSGGYTIVKFVDPGECTWNSPEDATEMRGLIVGGGGGGGGSYLMGGGGGGGGYLSFETLTITNQVLKINVGAGGAGGGSTLGSSISQNGETSSVSIGSDLTPTLKLAAPGGGRGGSEIQNQHLGFHYSGRSGGSGGGHGGTFPASTFGRSETVTAVIPDSQTAASIGLLQLGNAGAPCALEPYGGTGGGGGGAGAPAGCYIDTANGAVVVAGHGGDGYANNILGTEFFWAGGGGGGSFGYQTNIYGAGNGGRGGGGGGGAFGEQVATQPRQGSAGANGLNAASAGSAGAGGNGGVNTGGGGGAATHPFGPGGNGGSGIVVLKYTSTSWLAVSRQIVGGERLAPFTVQPQIAIQSGLNNETVTASTAVITATISSGGTLLGTATATASSGIATFNNLAINGTVGTRYRITYSSPELAPVTESITLTPAKISIAAISGVTAPATGATPVTAITSTGEYTGTVSWAETLTSASKFATASIYTATITLTAATGFSLSGVTVNFFTVAGATSVTNTAGSGVITAVFPATGGAVTPTFSAWSSVSKTYGDASFTVSEPTVTGSVPGTFEYSSATTSVISVSGTSLNVEGAGSSVITATFTPTDLANYNIATTTMTVNVAKASRTVTVDASSYSSIYYVDTKVRVNGRFDIYPALPTITATASAGTGTLSYEMFGWNTCQQVPRGVPGAMLLSSRYAGAGPCTVRAIISADSNYLAATSNSIRINFVYPLKYTIGYEKNGAIGSLEKASEIYQQGRSGITLPGVGGLTKEGYSFQGWSTSGSTPVLSGAYTPTGNVTLKAVWVPIDYQISYNADGGDSTPSASTVTFGDTFVLADSIARSSLGGISYQFAGWESGGSIYEAGESLRVGNSDRTFTAVWVQQYEVTYLANGGAFATGDTEKDGECSSNICNSNQGITLNSAPIRSGYTFTGWEDMNENLVSDTDTAVAGIQTTVTGSSYIFAARWLPISYDITYVSSGSTAPTQSPLNASQIFSIGSAVTRTGYTFDGWSDGISTYWPDSDYQVGTSNISLTAEWISDVSPYDGTNGSIACSIAGNFTVSENVVISESDCEGSVVIPEGVTDIDTELFKDNSSITSLIIPNTITGIGTDAFTNTASLTSYTYCGSELLEGDLTNAGLDTKTKICTNPPNNSTKIVDTPTPQQTSKIFSITQNCPTSATTILITGSFLTPISNISINDQMIDPSQWKQSVDLLEITISTTTLGLIRIQIYNGQSPLLPAQSVSLVETCFTPKPADPEPSTPAPTDTKNSTAANVDKPIVVENPAEVMKYLGSVFFATGSAKLTTATQKTLRSIASKIKSSSARQVLSLGNADSRGIVSRNRELSKARAKAVIAFLKKLNREPEYVLRWYGTSRPVATGNSASDLAKNRRVEIWRS